MKSLSILAVIPARGGSKRLPGKNLLPLAGKPLIAWTIEAALSSECFTTVCVSSEDEQVAQVARSYGAQVPFIRDPILASDEAKSIDVVINALDFYANQGQNFEAVVLLQPTSPLRTADDIRQGITFFEEKKAQSVIGVCLSEHSPLWSSPLGAGQSMQGFLPKQFRNARSQDLPNYYRINGAFYMANVVALRAAHGFFLDESIFGFVMEQSHSVDIDTELDLKFAGLLIEGN